jgi:hypothetical protein
MIRPLNFSKIHRSIRSSAGSQLAIVWDPLAEGKHGDLHVYISPRMDVGYEYQLLVYAMAGGEGGELVPAAEGGGDVRVLWLGWARAK